MAQINRKLPGAVPGQFMAARRRQPGDVGERVGGREFREALVRELPQPVARRYSGGKDIDAACGMLAAKSVA